MMADGVKISAALADRSRRPFSFSLQSAECLRGSARAVFF